MILPNIRKNRFFPYTSQRLTQLPFRFRFNRLPARTVILLLLLYLMIALVAGPPGKVHAQNDQITQAKQDLLQAFQAVQTAEQDGASNSSLAPLITELNSALTYEMIAEQGNSTAALQSINLSTEVSLKAQDLASQAQAASRENSILAYTTAIILAFVTALVILGLSSVKQELEKRKFFRSKIELRK